MREMNKEDRRPDDVEAEEGSITTFSQTEFSQLFFDAIDESIEERLHRTGGRFPDWDRAVARAKLEGVVPLKGSGPRVMATIPNRGITIEACYGDCLFRLDACDCNGLDHDMCAHPAAPLKLVLDDNPVPPTLCPLRTATFMVVLAREHCVDKDE